MRRKHHCTPLYFTAGPRAGHGVIDSDLSRAGVSNANCLYSRLSEFKLPLWQDPKEVASAQARLPYPTKTAWSERT